MEEKRRINRLRFGKALISLVFGLFITAKGSAQVLTPVVSVSPSSTNVSNGDTVTLTASAYCLVGVLTSITWQFNGGAFPTNVSYTTSGGVLNVNSSISSTLTIKNASSACAGTYTCTAGSADGLLGLFSSSAAGTISVPPIVNGLTEGSGMTTKGFKIQFSAPSGSNLVIQATSDMKTWTSLYTNVVKNGSVTYTDAVAKTASVRFYRAKLK